MTIGLSRVSALRVAGPQVPSGGMPKLRWNSRTPGLGVRAEVAVDPADLEAEVEQPALQGVDVVAGHQAAGQVGEDPVAELPAGLVETTEGQRADDAVDGEAALLLEGAYGELDGAVVHALGIGDGVTTVVEKADPVEQTGDLGDGGTRVPVPENRVQAVPLVGSPHAEPQAM